MTGIGGAILLPVTFIDTRSYDKRLLNRLALAPRSPVNSIHSKLVIDSVISQEIIDTEPCLIYQFIMIFLLNWARLYRWVNVIAILDNFILTQSVGLLRLKHRSRFIQDVWLVTAVEFTEGFLILSPWYLVNTSMIRYSNCPLWFILVLFV